MIPFQSRESARKRIWALRFAVIAQDGKSPMVGFPRSVERWWYLPVVEASGKILIGGLLS